HRVGDLPPEDHGMTPAAKRLVWSALAAVLTIVLLLIYRRYIWSSPAPTLALVKGGANYALRAPKLLGILLVAPFFLLMLARSLADLPWQQQLLSLLLRIGFVALLAVSLARISRTQHTEKVATVFLVDVSDSVTDDAIGDAKQAIARALATKKEDDIVR